MNELIEDGFRGNLLHQLGLLVAISTYNLSG